MDNRITSSIFAGIILLSPISTLAMDSLTLQVPVQIPNMHGEVHQLKTSCKVTQRGQLMGQAEDISGHGGLGTHQINATKQIQIDFAIPLPQCQRFTYQCDFTMQHYSGGSFQLPLASSGNDDDIWRTRQPGTSFKPEVKGAFKTPCSNNVIKTKPLRMTGQG